MFRTAAHQLSKQIANSKQALRTHATSAQKRALGKEQIGGAEKVVKEPSKVTPPPSAPKESTSGSSLPAILAFTAAGIGGVYYNDMIPQDILDQVPFLKKENAVVEKKEVKPVEKQEVKPVEKKEDKTVEKKQEKNEKSVKKEKTESKEKKIEAAVGNRVVQIHASSNVGRKSEPVPVQEHAPNGNRVGVSMSVATLAAEAKEEVATEEIKDVISDIAAEAEIELGSSFVENSKIDVELAKAHAAMKTAVDEAYLKGLDEASLSELKIRVVQLASEMNERTKWEAVRLREFLAMKEKEVGEKYMEELRKQRNEFEDLLARRLREQEGAITKAANEAIEAKEKSIESVVNAAASAQKAEYEEALKTNTELLKAELGAKYEAEFGTKLAEEKAALVSELQKKVASIEQMSQRLANAEQNLKISRNFESDSQRAHRISAAALALAEKMASSEGALEEYAALKAAAIESGVIASALEQVPPSVKNGIPTLPELQASFGDVYQIGREAAYVPAGRSGIGAQIAGKIFATVTTSPSTDVAPPADDEAKIADYTLARAKQLIHIGDLESAVVELEKLKGQTAFTTKDWKASAMDRIAVEKALKVIKMECALLNKNMGG